MGANFLVFVIVARTLGAEGFGQYSYVLTFLGLFLVVADFGTTAVLAREIAQVRSERETYWGSFLGIRLGLAILAGLLAAGLAFPLRPDLLSYLLVGAACMPLLASRFFEPLFQVSGRPWDSTTSSVAYAATHLVGVAVAVRFAGTLAAIFAAYLVANLVYTVLAFSLSRRALRPRWTPLDRAAMASIFRLAVPMGVGSLFVMLNMRADVFLLARLASDTAVGLYSAAFRFYDLAALVAVILATPILPIFAAQAAVDRSGLRSVYRRLNDLLGVVLIPVAVLTPIFSPTVMTLAFGEPFRAASPVLDVLAWVSILIFYAQLGSAANLAVGDVTHAYWNGALAATINIGLNLAWIPKYGYMGSAWATLVGDAALLGVSQAYVFRNLGVVFRPGPWLRIVAANAVLWLIARSGLLPAPVTVQLGLGLLAYVLLVVGLGLFRREDLAMLPGWPPKRAAVRGIGEPPQR